MSTNVLRALIVAAAAVWMPLTAYSQPVDDRIAVSADDWPWWRGPQRNGEANPNQDPPTEWSATKNIIWKAPVPGRGHSSPTVAGSRVFLAAADEERGAQSVVCYDRASGQQLWQAEVHGAGLMRKHPKSTGASSTVACDGERVFINFANSGAVYVTALSLDGRQLWQTKICDYAIHQGYGASPAVYQSLVLAAADSVAGGVLVALDRKTGELVWKRDRPKEPNYTSPIILHVAGRDQLFLSGCNLFSSYDPLDGHTLWDVKASTTECVTSTVTDGTRVFCSGGYPKNHLAALLADGSGTIAWETKDRVYVPSLLVREGHLFGVLDAGVATCWASDTGKQVWKKRLGGEFSASPVLVGDRIYATNESGHTFIFRANPQEFEQVGENQLGEQTLASPVICGGRLYLHVVDQVDGKRQEMLYCVGNAK